MAAASILINGLAQPKLDCDVGDVLTLSNDNDTGVTTWLWQLLDRPPGSAATLATPTAATTTVTVDLEGSYLFSLTINTNEDTATGIASILFAMSGLRAPAAGETTEVDGSDGWAPANNQAIAMLDKSARSGSLLTCISAASISAGQPVRVVGISTLSTGQIVPQINVANATSLANLPAVGVALSTVVGSGQQLNIRISGALTELTVNTSAMSPGSPVYVSDAGALAMTAGTVSHIVGHTLNQNASGRVLIAPGVSFNTGTWIGGFELLSGGGSKIPSRECVAIDSSAAATTLNLPAAAVSVGLTIKIKKIDSSANSVIVDANSSELIDGSATCVLSFQYDSIILVCDGAGWLVW
jgi:hypothetical protein